MESRTMKKEEKKKNFGRVFCMVAIYIIIITVLCVAFQHYLYSPMRVIGDSMNPVLSSGDILLVSESAYKEAEPGRFDLIVFKYKYDIHTRYIKRVIGLPGETVEIKDNTIYINGEELKEYYGYYDGEKKMDDYAAYTLRTDEYFVLGDNREHSVDSRSGDVGPVERDMIIGRAAFRLWPFKAVGSLKYQ